MDNKYYLFCGLKKIIFTVLNKKNEILFNKEIIFNHQELNENFEKLQNFLDHNIIEIEKKLKSYVKEINLIVV